jgi:hypothetical protein
MALRFKTTTNIAIAGSSIAHGLGATPTEVFVLPTIAAGAGQTYRYSASDATNVYLAQGTAAGSADVVAAVVHSIIQ